MANGKILLAAQLDNFDKRDPGIDCTPDGAGRTQQSFKEECDINTIIERFHLSGELPQVLRLPHEGDFTGIFDFQTAANAVRAAQETFNSLPAKIRNRFQNSPQLFVEFCTDEENRDEAIKLGLVNKPAPEPAPDPKAAPAKPAAIAADPAAAPAAPQQPPAKAP